MGIHVSVSPNLELNCQLPADAETQRDVLKSMNIFNDFVFGLFGFFYDNSP